MDYEEIMKRDLSMAKSLVKSNDIETLSIYADFKYLDNIDSFPILKVDTATVNIKEDTKGLRTAMNIADNLEVIISNSKTTWHFVKGNMRNLFAKEYVNMSASMSKADQKLTKQSIIFQCALTVLCNAYDKGFVSNEYDIHLTISLPPEDTEDSRVEKIRENLIGTYNVKFPRLEKDINIVIKSVEVYAEPVAASYYYALENVDEIEEETAVFLDCGGRSKGAVLVKNGSLVLNGTVTDIGGGERLLLDISKNVAKRLGITRLNTNVIRDGLAEAEIKIGTKTIDIAEDINNAKANLAEACVSTINKLLDETYTQIEEVQHIICTGRTFIPSIRNGVIVSPSLVEFIKSEMNESDLELNIKFERVENDNPVVIGLLYYTLEKLSKDIEGV